MTTEDGMPREIWVQKADDPKEMQDFYAYKGNSSFKNAGCTSYTLTSQYEALQRHAEEMAQALDHYMQGKPGLSASLALPSYINFKNGNKP